MYYNGPAHQRMFPVTFGSPLVVSQHVLGIFMTIVRRSECIPLPVVVCPVVAVVMLGSRIARCVHCVENVAWQATLHLVGLTFTYLSKMHSHSNISILIVTLNEILSKTPSSFIFIIKYRPTWRYNKTGSYLQYRIYASIFIEQLIFFEIWK